MSHRLNLEGAKVVVTGNADGHPVTLEGNIKNATLSAERKSDYMDTFNGKYLLSDNTRYFFEFDTNNEDGVAYRLQVPVVTINRTARIEAKDRTVEAFEKAREQVGAPKKAKVRVGEIQRLDGGLMIEPVDTPAPIMLEFYWSEKVPA